MSDAMILSKHFTEVCMVMVLSYHSRFELKLSDFSWFELLLDSVMVGCYPTLLITSDTCYLYPDTHTHWPSLPELYHLALNGLDEFKRRHPWLYYNAELLIV